MPMPPPRVVASIVAALAVVAVGHGQTGAASVTGTIVDGMSGVPLSGMTVTAQPGAGRPATCPSQSDASGRFRCDIPAGDVLLRATERAESRAYVNQPPATYADGLFGARTANGAFQLLTVKSGEPIHDVTIRMWKHASLGGRVLDADGRGLAGVDVQALRLIGAGSPRQSVFSRSAITGADGAFEIDGNVAGEYIVAVKTVKPGLKARAVASPTVYYPQATSLVAAQTITVEPGQVRSGVDIRVPSGPRFSITGVVTGRDVSREPGARSASGADPTTILLVPADAPQTPEGFEVARTDDWSAFGGGGANTPGGGFRLSNVPAGRYLLRVLLFPRTSGSGHTMGAGSFMLPMRGAETLPDAPTLWAELPIEVTDHGVSDLIVPLRHGATVSGRVEFDSGAEATGPRPSFAIAIAAADGRSGAPIGPTDADGQFRTAGLPAGRFVMGPLPPTISPTLGLPEWSVQSISVGGRPVTAGFDLGTTAITDALITMTNRPATISGRVIDAAGAPRGDASIYIVPADRALWHEINWFAWPGRMRERRTKPDGTYRDLIAPGDYFVVASADAPDDWMRPSALASLSRNAVPVTISAREQKAIDLHVR